MTELAQLIFDKISSNGGEVKIDRRSGTGAGVREALQLDASESDCQDAFCLLLSTGEVEMYPFGEIPALDTEGDTHRHAPYALCQVAEATLVPSRLANPEIDEID